MTTLASYELKARKKHKCSSCLTYINPGETYLREAYANDGSVFDAAYHPECRDWEVYLNDINNIRYDEWYLLHEHVAEGGLDVLEGAPAVVVARFKEHMTDDR